MNSKKYTLLILLTVVMFSCEKDKDLTKSELLVQKPWKLTASTVSPALDIEGLGLISDLFAVYNDCVKDDIWIFKSAGNFSKEEGATKCNPTDLTVWDFGSWTFNFDETVLTTSSSVYGLSEYEILELTASVLRLQYQIADTLDNIYTFAEAYGH